MGFPTRYFLDNISDCGKSYTHNVIFYFGGALGLRLCSQRDYCVCSADTLLYSENLRPASELGKLDAIFAVFE